jgi:hypothetical protein
LPQGVAKIHKAGLIRAANIGPNDPLVEAAATRLG